LNEVQIIDVSPRDGLQNERVIVPIEKKIKLIEMLIDSNINMIEATSFVHPLKVPQMADAEDVLKSCERFKEVQLIALIPNLKGFQRAVSANISEVNWITAATETFNLKNIGMTVQENFSQLKQLMDQRNKHNIRVCFSIAVSFGCPYEGEVNSKNVLTLVERALEIGVHRIGIADTIGIASPSEVKNLLKEVLKMAEGVPVSIHLHDTRGMGLTNAYVAYEAGVRIFETSAGGIGGCPFAPGASGNLATEDLVYMFERIGVKTGVNFEKLLEAADYAASLTTNKASGRIRHVEKRE